MTRENELQYFELTLRRLREMPPATVTKLSSRIGPYRPTADHHIKQGANVNVTAYSKKESTERRWKGVVLCRAFEKAGLDSHLPT